MMASLPRPTCLRLPTNTGFHRDGPVLEFYELENLKVGILADQLVDESCIRSILATHSTAIPATEYTNLP